MRIVRLFMLCVSLAFGLCAVELLAARYYKKTFSVIGWKADIQQDDELVYSLRPNSDIVWQRYGMEMKFHTNNLGFRSPQDTIVPKPSGVFRILMAGDSFVFGDGLADGETIPNLVQEKLTALELPYTAIEVINMGVPGYSPDQSYRQLVKYTKILQPDLVVWNFISWHINGMVNNTGQQYYRSSLYSITDGKLTSLDAKWNKIYVHNRLLGYATLPVRNSHLFDLVLNRLFYSPFFSGIPNIPREDKLVWAQKKLVLEIQSLHTIAKENGSEFMFVVLPSLDGLSSPENSEFLNFLNGVKKQLDQYSAVLFVDINADLLARMTDGKEKAEHREAFVLGSESDPPEAWFFDSPNEHPNELGASISAEVLAASIQNLITQGIR